jgi:hypothetical protein
MARFLSTMVLEFIDHGWRLAFPPTGGDFLHGRRVGRPRDGILDDGRAGYAGQSA